MSAAGSDTPPSPDTTPIDAHFEPADTTVAPARAAGPGWAGVGIASAFAAGVGGLIGITAQPEPTPASSADISTEEIEALQSALEAQRSAFADTLETLRSDLKDTTDRIDTLRRADTAPVSDDDALVLVMGEIDALREDIVRLDTALVAVEPEGDGDDLTATILSRLDRLEGADAQPASPRMMNRTVSSLQGRVEALETGQSDLASAFAEGRSTLETLSTRIDTLGARLDAELDALALIAPDIVARDPASDAPSESGSAPSNAAPDQAASSEPAPETNTATVPVAVPIETPESEADTEPTAAPDPDRGASALASIKSAAARGEGFASAHAKLLRALPGEESVILLGEIASDGAHVMADLKVQFKEAENAYLETVSSAPETVERLTAGSLRLRISPEGDPSAARLGEASAKLGANDLSGAVSSVASLEGPAKTAMADWLTDARARLMLNDLIARIDARIDELNE